MGCIYPIKAMNQMRTHNMMRMLATDYLVDLATPTTSIQEVESSIFSMDKISGRFINLGSLKPQNNKLKKRLTQLYEYANYYICGTDREVSHNKLYQNKIVALANSYDIVISNYWEASLFFRKLGGDIIKILDPHYSVAENFEVANNYQHSWLKEKLELRKLKKNLKLEEEVLNYSDAALPLSKRGLEEFRKIDQNKPLLLVPDGNDLDYYLEYKPNPDPKTILFYGSMGSHQNVQAFFRFYNNIHPELKREFPDLKLLVVGANPAESIKVLNNGNDIIVTGFVDDVRPYLAKAWLKIIPLEHGSGFRGRIVELMAMGIPVIGTHNALDSVGFENGQGGFISDGNDELVETTLRMLKEPDFRNTISEEAIKFVKMNYSLEATFGKISNFLEILKRS